MLGAEPDPLKYDIVIGNPPYMKIAKDAPEAKAMPDVCYGAPNLYFLFAAMGMFDLCPNGELVYIIPRSWTSGAYFKKFRQKFLKDGVLEHIHLFVSRDKVFENESVLQETMIIKVRKATVIPENVVITTTQSNKDFSNKTTFEAAYNTVVSGEDKYVYLVTNEQEVETLELLNRWSNTLPSIGLKMKTGLTVDFRNREALRDVSENHAVPLFYSQHIQDGKVVFPIGKEHEYIVTNQASLLQPNVNYLFVKRFTAKEEHRRLQCGVYLARKYPDYSKISTQNKINFIGGLKELSECIVYGLYAVLWEDNITIDSDSELIDEQKFVGKRKYLDQLIYQINHSYANNCYDAAAVLMRRLFEVLLVLSYQNYGIDVYFNEKRNGISSFSSATLKALYSEAKKPLPNNLSMSLSELVKKGLIMEDVSAKGSTPKMYVLTLEGEESIKNMHPTEAKEKKASSKPRKQRQKVDSPYATINCDDLNLDRYPEVKLLKDFKEKMILILYIVTNEEKGEWFTTADVLCLMTDIFGESATKKQVEGVFTREKRWFKCENIEGSNKFVHRKLLNEAKSFAQSLRVENVSE